MNIFKYIIEHLFKKGNADKTLKLQDKSQVEASSMYAEDKNELSQKLKSQVIARKKEIEITERAGDGFGFKKNISC